MPFVATAVTHGAISFYKEVVERAVANGWTRIEDIEDRAGLAGASVVQTSTVPIDYNLVGLVTGVWYELPIMYLGAFSAYKNQTIPVVEGVDYDINRVRGRLRLRAGGQFDNGAGQGVGRFTVPAGYEIKRGWTILGSSGSSGLETIRIGLRFDALSANPANPMRCGPRWTLFRNWTVSVTDYDSNNLASRNASADDVCQYVHPTAVMPDVQMTITADRIISMGRSAGYSAWCYAGILNRFRPVTEQDCVSVMIGNRGTHREGIDGVIGQTNVPGSMGVNHGSAWLFDLGLFSGVANPVELNANYWSFEAGEYNLGYTPSRRLLNTPGLFGTPNYYVELHDAIVGRNVTTLNSPTNMIYGSFNGVKAPLIYEAVHGLEVTYDGTPYRIWSVGSSWTRFVAVAKI